MTSNKKNALFIVNPFSGLGKQQTIHQLIEKEIDHAKWNCEIVMTAYAGHARELSREAASRYDVVAAVGGDGTVNEVGSGLLGTTTLMAIIPAGSGNGLARHLRIPLKVNRALQLFNNYQLQPIDVMKVNNRYSFNVSGVGFDGHISHLFADIKRRGPLGYVKLISMEFSKYQAKTYHITIDGKTRTKKAFLISFANSTQYGNNAHIAPSAVIDDGLIDICVISDFPKYTAPALLLSLFDQTIDQSKYDDIYLGRHIVVESDEPLTVHVDGEPLSTGNRLDIDILPLSLNMMVPDASFPQNAFINQLTDMVPQLSTLTNNWKRN
ncbi:YegS/Rv2252/BmrU family lipid kinase [Breznakibacter xylanolyticus]|uniref:YegS/Rv2252/BmrU family lipid kinase n=1 Tax=Breznakibacter xylanolyticus TaxID=990 RepID=A0A2W7PAE0_9BACT|nr:diacylglycerol kinase family protein [Breznakibacter xylanolyticus]PZX20312.1 YegS/Rv2252/BmrU family lipid kinase [Breznakibacter xylanolyticus]